MQADVHNKEGEAPVAPVAPAKVEAAAEKPKVEVAAEKPKGKAADKGMGYPGDGGAEELKAANNIARKDSDYSDEDSSDADSDGSSDEGSSNGSSNGSFNF